MDRIIQTARELSLIHIFPADPGPVEDGGAHTDEGVIPHGAAVDDGPMAHGAALPQRDIFMDHGVILDVGVLAHLNVALDVYKRQYPGSTGNPPVPGW